MPLDNLPADVLDRIDERCDAFEAAWNSSTPPSLEAYLCDWEGQGRLELFSHLLELEIDLRIRRGESASARDYAKWFAEFSEVIVAQFGRAVDGSPPTSPTASAVRRGSNASRTAPFRAQNGFLPGSIFADRYRIVSLLGKGGMGEVYRAEDLRLGETVALKLLPSEFASDPGRLALFHDEVRLSRGVTHPNICRVHDLGVADGVHFLSMAYIDGENLQTLLRRIGRLPPAKAAELARQIASGLAAAHRGGVLHRDLKPANVMIDGRGHARITDFGLACAVDRAASAAGPIGTPIYMAPETYLHHATHVSSDVYSFGLVLYEMCTGKRFCRATTSEQLREHHENIAAPDLEELSAECEPVLASIVCRCLEPDPSQRPSSAVDLLTLLPGGDPLAEALAAGETPSPEAVAAAGSTPPLPRERQWWLLGSMIVGLLLVVGLADYVFRSRGFEQPPSVWVKHAREQLETCGYDGRGAYEAWGFAFRPRGPSSPTLNDDSSPEDVYFWYRSSPLPLAPILPHWSGEEFLTVDERRPAFDVAGMAWLRFDLKGRLQSLRVIPNPGAPANQNAGGLRESTGAVDDPPDRLLASAGYSAEERDRLQSTPASFVPPMFADRLFAWRRADATGALAGNEPDVEAVYAELQGRPVYFDRFPESGDLAMQPTRSSTGTGLRAAIMLAWMPILFGGGILIAGKNWRAGRGDKRGAQRVACFLALAALVHWLLSGSHAASRYEFDMFLTALAGALLLGALVWVGYLAVEPTVRRHWPQTLVSWTRLVSGRVRDPRVGRDVLIGMVAGVFAAAGKWSLVAVPELCGWPCHAFANVVDLTPLHGTRAALGAIALDVCLSALYGLFFQLLFLMLLRILLRRWSAAVVCYIAFMTTIVAVQYQPMPWAFFVTALEMTACAWLFLRVGLLSVVVMHFCRLLCKWPLTWDWSQWHSDSSLICCITLFGIALAAFVATTGRRASAL